MPVVQPAVPSTYPRAGGDADAVLGQPCPWFSSFFRYHLSMDEPRSRWSELQEEVQEIAEVLTHCSGTIVNEVWTEALDLLPLRCEIEVLLPEKRRDELRSPRQTCTVSYDRFAFRYHVVPTVRVRPSVKTTGRLNVPPPIHRAA